jgi:protein HOOK3
MEPGFPQDVPLWINTFEGLSSTCDDVSELCDGVALTEIMAQIAPSSYFDFDIVRGSSSWASHKINLSYLVRGLEEYYKTVHDKEFVLDFIDLDKIAQDKDLNVLAVLMEFVVGAAVQCPDKQRYIGNIMSMSEDSQQTLMSLAKSLMQRPATEGALSHPTPTDTGDASSEASNELAQLRTQVQVLESSNEDLLKQLDACKVELDAQRKTASEEVEQARSALQEGFDAVKRQNSDLRRELDLAQERERELRTSLQGDYEERSEKDVVKWESTVRRLEEEHDIMASKLEDYSKLKSQSERLREKMEDMDSTSKGLKERLAVVEESNAKRLDRILELEGMEKERDFNKKKIEQYKNAAKDLELKVLKMTSEAQVKDQDAVSLAEGLKHAQEKARNLEHELEDAKRELQEAAEGSADAGRALSGLAQDFVPPDVAEKLVRLERENEALKAQVEDPSSRDAEARIESLQIEAEDRERRVADREKEGLQLKRDLAKAHADAAISKERLEARIVELEEQVIFIASLSMSSIFFSLCLKAHLIFLRRCLRCSPNFRATKPSQKR